MPQGVPRWAARSRAIDRAPLPDARGRRDPPSGHGRAGDGAPLAKRRGRDAPLPRLFDGRRAVDPAPSCMPARPAISGRSRRWALFFRRDIVDSGSIGVYLSVTCAEDLPWVDLAEAAREAEGTALGDYRAREQKAACALWPRGEIPSDYRTMVASDKPVLIFTGALDPVTPPAHGDRVAKTLSHSRHVVVPDGGHSFDGLEGLDCVSNLRAEFVERGSAEGLDTRCVAAMHRPPFPTEIPKLIARRGRARGARPPSGRRSGPRTGARRRASNPPARVSRSPSTASLRAPRARLADAIPDRREPARLRGLRALGRSRGTPRDRGLGTRRGDAPPGSRDRRAEALDLTLRRGRELGEVLDERPHRAVEALDLRVRRLDHVVLVGRVRAAAVAEAEVAGRQLQRLAGEDVARLRAGVARPEDRIDAAPPVDGELRADERRVGRGAVRVVAAGHVRPRCRRSRAWRGAP